MNIKEMHYDFKQKLNEIDSQKYRDLVVPEIDWKLNEAQELFAKMIAQPRIKSQYGFETSQRTIDDIRTIVVDQKPVDYIVPIVYDPVSWIVALPTDYWFLVKIRILATKGTCANILLYDSKSVQHDDEVESSPFEKSSFEWRIANYRFNREGIRIFTDGTFDVARVGLEYLKQPRPMWNAEDWIGGTYNTLAGVALTGTQDCELPVGVHREIVDLAVLITSQDLNMPNQQTKQNKVRLDQ